jgi:hypothetical protein
MQAAGTKPIWWSRSLFVAFWGPRMSDEAASRRWVSGMLGLASVSALPMALALGEIGVHMHQRALTALAYVCVAAGGVGLVLANKQLKQSYRLARGALGFQYRGLPPREPAVYERWCQAYHLVPYGANDGRPVQH